MKKNKSLIEFEMGWNEYFKDKVKPENKEQEKKELEEFYHWYNCVRKQSDTGKTPNEMYKEIYGKEPAEDNKEESRMMNFDGEEYEEEQEKEKLIEIASNIFDNNIWHKAKNKLKDIGRREFGWNMFITGFFIYDSYIKYQFANAEKEFKNMSKEDIERIIKNKKI